MHLRTPLHRSELTPETLLDLRDAGDYLGYHERTVRRRINDGILPAVRVGDRGHLRVRVADLDDLYQAVPSASAVGSEVERTMAAWITRELANAPELDDLTAARIVALLQAPRITS